MRKETILAGLTVLSLAWSAAQATHIGSAALGAGEAETINTDSAIPLQDGQWAFSLRLETTEFDPLTDSQLTALREKDAEADLHSIGSLLTTSMGVAFGLTDNLTLGIKLPYLLREDIREPAHGHHEEDQEHDEHGVEDEHAAEDEEHAEDAIERLGNSEGLGDLSLYGLWRFRERADTQSHIGLLFGVKAPTGTTDERTADGHKLEAELQPGSGSWDPFIGLAGSRGFGPWKVNGSVLYTLATEGAQNTDLGDLVAYNAGLAYQPSRGDGSLAWSLLLELNGEWRDELEAAGAMDPNSGGHWLHLSPGIAVGGQSWKAFATLSYPIVDDANGYQDERDYRFLMGVQFAR